MNLSYQRPSASNSPSELRLMAVKALQGLKDYERAISGSTHKRRYNGMPIVAETAGKIAEDCYDSVRLLEEKGAFDSMTQVIKREYTVQLKINNSLSRMPFWAINIHHKRRKTA